MVFRRRFIPCSGRFAPHSWRNVPLGGSLLADCLTAPRCSDLVALERINAEDYIMMGEKSADVRERFTDVHVKRGGRWQTVTSHSTPLPR